MIRAAGRQYCLSILGMLDADWRGEYYLFGEPATYRPADEWTQNAYLSAGISYRF